jgi:hypothetical protein
MGNLFSNARRPYKSNVECSEGPIFENGGSVYTTWNYAHRHNADGSFDSVCLNCLQTVASAPTDAALAPNEMQHRCIAPGPNILEGSRR